MTIYKLPIWNRDGDVIVECSDDFDKIYIYITSDSKCNSEPVEISKATFDSLMSDVKTETL